MATSVNSWLRSLWRSLEDWLRYWKILSALSGVVFGLAAGVVVTVLYGWRPIGYALTLSAGSFLYAYYTDPLLRRRIVVYYTAVATFADYKLLRNRTKRLYPNNDTCAECLEMWENVHSRNAHRAYNAMVSLAGIWIKSGQYLSSRADVLPDVYVKVLSGCQDKVPFRSFAETKETIENDLGRPLPLLFDSFEITPIACASIAQVHRAVVNGEQVVVKVQHKGIEAIIHQDLVNLEKIISWIAWAEPDFDFRPIMNEWSKEVPNELDFVHEAANMKRVERESQESIHAPKSSPLHFDAVFPQVYDKLTSARVLTMTYIDGFKVTDIGKLDEHRVDRAELVQNLARAFGNQIFRFGFFNGDPHPGNILVQVKNGKATPALLDFGLTKEIDEKTQICFSNMAVTAADSDLAGLLNTLDDLGVRFNVNSEFLAKETLNITKFFFRDSGPKKKMQEGFRKHRDDQAKRVEIELQDDESLRRNPIDAFPEALVFFQRTIFLIRGIATALGVQMPYLELLTPFARAKLMGSANFGSELNFPRYAALPSTLSERVVGVMADLARDKLLFGGQLVVYQGGVVVADVVAGRRERHRPDAVTPATLFNVFSSTKAVTAVALHICVEKGLLQYSDLVQKHWPGFKTSCTVEQILRHTSGLQNAGGAALEKNFFYATDWNRMLNIVAGEDYATVPGSKEAYHYLSFGFLAGGLVEKVSKMSLREFVRREISEPLGIAAELQMGLEDPASEIANLIVDLEAEKRRMKSELRGAALTGRLAGKIKDIHEIANRDNSESLLFSNPTMFNHKLVRSSVLPAANGQFSARALAKFYAMLANGGIAPGGGPRILREDTVRRLGDRAGVDSASFGLGLQVLDFDGKSAGRLPALGHSGVGGQFGGFDPTSRVAVAITLNQLTFRPTASRRILSTVFEGLGLPVPVFLQKDGARGAPDASLLSMS